MRRTQQPTRSEPDQSGRVEVRHPAFGIMAANRINGQVDLFGSNIAHQGYVRISFHEAHAIEDGFETLIVGTHLHKTLIAQVDVSEAAWVGFISRMNMGGGTPCTIAYRRNGDLVEVPGIPPPLPPDESLRARARSIAKTLDEDTAAAVQRMKDLGAKLPTKADRQAFQNLMDQVIGANTKTNMEFGRTILREEAEKLIVAAKVEIDAAVNARITSLGLSTLQQLEQQGVLTPNEKRAAVRDKFLGGDVGAVDDGNNGGA